MDVEITKIKKIINNKSTKLSITKNFILYSLYEFSTFSTNFKSQHVCKL